LGQLKIKPNNEATSSEAQRSSANDKKQTQSKRGDEKACTERKFAIFRSLTQDDDNCPISRVFRVTPFSLTSRV